MAITAEFWCHKYIRYSFILPVLIFRNFPNYIYYSHFSLSFSLQSLTLFGFTFTMVFHNCFSKLWCSHEIESFFCIFLLNITFISYISFLLLLAFHFKVIFWLKNAVWIQFGIWIRCHNRGFHIATFDTLRAEEQ